VCVGFVMFGCVCVGVYISVFVSVCMCGFCNVWVCVGVVFVSVGVYICGCVYVWVCLCMVCVCVGVCM